MSNRHGTAADSRAYDRHDGYRRVHPEDLFDHVLSRRVVAFFIDALLIGLMMIPVALVVFVLGLVTFGLGWFLMAPLFVLVALAYIALAAGGPASATVGMRFTGIELRTWNGRPMFPLLAVAHAVLFWVSVSLLTPFILLVGFVTERRQLVHDILLGVEVVNTDTFYD